MSTQRRSRDRDKTVSEILEGARKLFSEHGLQGTSIRMLEEETGVSKGLILYHFGSKEKLFDEVLSILADEYAEHLKKLIRPDVGYAELAEATVRESLRYQQQHQQHRRMQLWAFLEGRQPFQEIDLRLTQRLIEMVSTAQAAGQAVTTIAPIAVPFIIRGAIEYWVRNRSLIEEVIGQRGLSYDEVEYEFVAQLVALVQ